MDEHIREELLAKRSEIPTVAVYIFLAVALIGFGTFAVQIMGSDPGYAWQIFLVNFLFWTGIAQAGIVFSCIGVGSSNPFFLITFKVALERPNFSKSSIVYN